MESNVKDSGSGPPHRQRRSAYVGLHGRALPSISPTALESHLHHERDTYRVKASLVLVLVRLRELLEDGRDDLIREEASRWWGDEA